jgi:hypothetical protein
MAGYLEDDTQWRLRTNGGIPFKWLSLEGDFESVKADVNLKLLIQGYNLIPFCVELFPPPIQFGAVSIPQYVQFGNMNLVCKNVRFRSFDVGLPIDPMNFDFSAPVGTYFKTIEVELSLGSSPTGSRNPADPFTFLELSADASGEYIHVPPANTKFQPTDENGEPDGDPTPNRVPILPHTILVPQSTWSVKWSKIPLNIFRNAIQPRIELALGKVNSDVFSILFASYKETLLFTGYSFRYAYTWRDGYVDNPFVDLDMKFLEKRVFFGGKVRGHQDVWRPGVGWDRLLINGLPTYEAVDFNTIFAP